VGPCPIASSPPANPKNGSDIAVARKLLTTLNAILRTKKANRLTSKTVAHSHSIIISHHNALISKRKFPWLIANSRKVIRQKFSLLILKGNFHDSELLGFDHYRHRSDDFSKSPAKMASSLAEKTLSGSAATTWT
jgi:hypothetical protein